MKKSELRQLIREEISKVLKEDQFRPARYNNKPSITDGLYHYLFGKSKRANDHTALYMFDKSGKEVASYDITDEFSSIKKDPKLLAAYEELSKQAGKI